VYTLGYTHASINMGEMEGGGEGEREGGREEGREREGKENHAILSNHS
jgi:hypothetical protein